MGPFPPNDVGRMTQQLGIEKKAENGLWYDIPTECNEISKSQYLFRILMNISSGRSKL